MTTEKPTALRRRKPGDIHQLRRVLWGVLIEIEAEVLSPQSTDTKLRAANSLAQISGSYLKALELTDVVERLDALEARLPGDAPTPIRRAS